jgi:type VI secretion system secreted protein VgrG
MPGIALAQTTEQTIESLRQQVETLTQKVNALSALVQTTPVAGLQSERDLALRSRRDSEWTAKKLVLTAEDVVMIKSGAASIELRKDGTIRIRGQDIDVSGSKNTILKGSKILGN